MELIIIQKGPHMGIRAKRHDRTGRPVVCRLWIKPQTCDFHDFFSYFVADGSFTAEGKMTQHISAP